MSIEEGLVAARAEGQLVRVYRADVETGWVDGYVAALGPEFFALEILDETVRFNGFSCMRYREVSDVEVPAPFAKFKLAALRSRGLVRDARLLDLASVAGIFRSAGNIPLFAVHVERQDPDCCYIGRCIECDDDVLTLHLIKPDAIWEEEPECFLVGQITRVDFGGGYEEALSLVAASRSRRTTLELHGHSRCSS